MSVTQPLARALSALLFCGCADRAACLSLGGGFGGEDIEAIEAECRADPEGYDCESDAFLERDEILCLAQQGWSIDEDERLDRVLLYHWRNQTVIWAIQSVDCGAGYSATTGEQLGVQVCGEPT